MELFSKVLTKTDVETRLCIPMKALHGLTGGDEVADHLNILVVDSNEQEWEFCCYMRPNGHPKPAFTTGWVSFVRAKDFRVSDKVIFYRKENEGGDVQFRIEVKKWVLKLLGQHTWVDKDQYHLHAEA